MDLLSNLLWAAGDLTLAVMLCQALRLRLVTRYRYFYAYLCSVLCSDLISLYFTLTGYEAQALVRWGLEFVTALCGFGVTWEIYKQTLLPYKGVRRMARTALSLVFGAVMLKAVVEFSGSPIANLFPTTRELERDLRAVEAAFLVILFSLIFYYAIPLGRNLWSMVAGYGLLIVSGVITLTLSSQFTAVNWKWWSLSIQAEYWGTLAIWLVGTWCYAPNPVAEVELERDYERISAQTARAFGRVREHLTQPWFER